MTATRKMIRAARRSNRADMPRRVRKLLLDNLVKGIGAAGRRSPWRLRDGTMRRVPKCDNGPRVDHPRRDDDMRAEARRRRR